MKTYENGAEVYVNRFMTIYPGIITGTKKYEDVPGETFYTVKFPILEPYDEIKICEEEFDPADVFETLDEVTKEVGRLFIENLKVSYSKVNNAIADKGGFDFIKNSEVDYDELKLKELAGIGDDE